MDGNEGVASDMEKAINKIKRSFPDYLFTLGSFNYNLESDDKDLEISIEVEHKETDFKVEIKIEVPANYNDDPPKFSLGNHNLTYHKFDIEEFIEKMNTHLENIFNDDPTQNWLSKFLDVLMRSWVADDSEIDNGSRQRRHDISESIKRKSISTPDMHIYRVSSDSKNSKSSFIPYPALHSITWSPFGTLTIVRNIKYQRNKYKEKKAIVREIYTTGQLTQFLTSCEKKTHSDSNLNTMNTFLLEDDEENKKFYTEVDGDEEDYLNIQISFEKTNYTRTRGESIEDLKDEVLYAVQSDFVHYNFSEVPEIQRRIGNLCQGTVENPGGRTRFELQLKFQTFDIEHYITKHTQALSDFLSQFHFERSFKFDDNFLCNVIEKFLADFKDYREFKYWCPQEQRKSVLPPHNRTKIFIENLPTDNRSKDIDFKPFYTNPVKANLFKELFSNIMPKSKFHDDFSRAALVALMTEIILLRNHFLQLVTRTINLLKKEDPKFDVGMDDNTINSQSEIDSKFVITIYEAIQKQITKMCQNKGRHKDDRQDENKRKEAKRSTSSFIFDRSKEGDPFVNLNNKITNVPASKKLVQCRPKPKIPSITSFRLLDEKDLQTIKCMLKTCSELLNRRENFQHRIYIDKIMSYHKSLLFYITGFDKVLKQILNLQNSVQSCYNEDNSGIHEEIKESIKKNSFTCSICSIRVLSKIIICSQCFHGGHQEHMNEWFAHNEYCPQCFRCACFKDHHLTGLEQKTEGILSSNTSSFL